EPVASPPAEDPGVSKGRTAPWKRILQVVAMLVVLGFIFGGVIPAFADYSDMIDAVTAMSGWTIAGLAVLAAAYLVEYWFVVMVALPGLRFAEAAVVHTSTTAVVNTVPAGAAISFGLMYAEYYSWGFPPATTTAALLVTGVWDTMSKIAIPAIVLAGMAWVTNTPQWWIMAAIAMLGVVIVIGLVVVLLRAPRVADRIGQWLDRPVNAVLGWFKEDPIDIVAKIRFFRRASNVIIAGRWWILTILTVGSQLLLVTLLVASIRAVGVPADVLPFLLILTAYAVARVLAAIPITPGGLGIVEVAYLSILTPGVPEEYRAAVAAGVLLFRGLVWFPPVLLGIPALVFWRVNKSWRRDATTEPRGPAIEPESAAQTG
ncbi:MAG: lysylphosphatidylglycerol synthase domain-containing protein, partial [Actinomycetota bacterium]|nr:lysylphosphatidylglycerol synthase domain-containing protein [Actinomycetota bacterium]